MVNAVNVLTKEIEIVIIKTERFVNIVLIKVEEGNKITRLYFFYY